MITETKQCQPVSAKKMTIHVLGTIIGLALATYLEKQGYPWIGWMIGIFIINMSISYAYRHPENRWNRKNIIVLVLSCIGIPTLFNGARTLGWW